jgi:tetratricopeptide (TPR) repeat protein
MSAGSDDFKANAPAVPAPAEDATDADPAADKASASDRPPGTAKPVSATTVFEAAVRTHQDGRPEDAIPLYRQILSANPRFAPGWNNLGIALRAAGKVEAAVACLRRGLALDGQDAGAWSNLGNALRMLGRYGEAKAAHLKSLELKPDVGRVHYNLALTYRDLAETDEAMANFERAEELGFDQSEMYWDRALTYLIMGDLGRGFEEYEWRWKLPESPPRFTDRPLWDGGDLAGKTLLVYAEQGFGDAIQFVRFLPMAAAKGGKVVFECPPLLVRLARSSPALEAVELVPADGATPDFDVHLPLLSLARVFGTTLDDIPATAPYLALPAAEDKTPLGGDQLDVGLVWAGKPSHKNDRNRSIPFKTLLPLLDLEGVRYSSLQMGPRADEVSALAAEALIQPIGDRLRDFADTAAVLRGLDLVITVDTAVAHLAGALARPVWTLLPYSPDWRWLYKREDAPWYPTMRLFRQATPGDWDEVVDRVRAALIDFAGEKERK